MPTIIDNIQPDVLRSVLAKRAVGQEGFARSVADIICQVRDGGDDALRVLTARFDGHAPKQLRISADQITERAAKCPQNIRDALVQAAERIHTFHTQTMPQDFCFTDSAGVEMGYRYSAVSAAGIYVPGGRATYPSSVLMNGIPARVAGVKRLVVCTPTPEEYLNPAVMAALEILQIDEVYAIGGAQAIAAMAYGTETICPVDFIAGPGNSFVTEAKRAVFGQVGIDSLAGPSEVTVVADNGAEPSHVAWDLLAQAEHDEMAQSIVISDDRALLLVVEKEIKRILNTLPRSKIAQASWREYGLLLAVEDIMEAANLVDIIAPEHLILSLAEPEKLFKHIHHAGSVFLGYHSPEAAGDYVTGPNHVLPTSGSARFASGLSCGSFMKHTSFQKLSIASLEKIAPAAMALAEAEGLDAHKNSIAIRLAHQMQKQ